MLTAINGRYQNFLTESGARFHKRKNMDNMKHRRLQELDRSDFEIVRDEPDIRGWDVRGINGRKIGAVEELIVDAHEKKVRYMVVDLDDNELKLKHRKVLIPIGLAELDQKDDDVLIPNISPQQLGDLPDYDRNNLSADVERTVFSTLNSRTQPGIVQDTPKKTSETTVREARDAREIQDRKDRENRGAREERKEMKREENKERKEMAREERNERKEMAKEERKEKEKEEGRDEVDPDFYRHEYYNLDNLYKNRLHEITPVKSTRESEFEKGLRLWERRSEGTVIPDENRRQAGDRPTREEGGNYREIDEKQRMEMIRNRRNNYEQRRFTDREPSQNRREYDGERKDEDFEE